MIFLSFPSLFIIICTPLYHHSFFFSSSSFRHRGEFRQIAAAEPVNGTMNDYIKQLLNFIFIIQLGTGEGGEGLYFF
jgi:hypothetical protein